MWLPVLLLFMYDIAIHHERGDFWRALVPLAYDMAVLDIILNYSLFALFFWDWPYPNEVTFSMRLPRLNQDRGWRGAIARVVT